METAKDEIIRSIDITMEEYPDSLRQISDPPQKLYYIGDISLAKKRTIAIVGSRTTTVYGRNTALNIAEKLSEAGIVVVSGLAMGIDTMAHRGALKGGETIAVMPCGLDMCYPPQNRELKGDIEKRGLVISEYPPGCQARKYFFPNRNRIISGLCEATIVVQARTRSGALITAELAAEQGREVFAVPGNIDSLYNGGNNRLIRDGAVPVISPEDLIEYLGLEKRREKGKYHLELSEKEFEICTLLEKKGEMSVDSICLHIGDSPAYINGILAVLEMKGLIFVEMGKIFLANM